MKTFQTIKALLLAALLVPLLALGQGGVVPPSFIKCSITTQNLVAAGVATAGSACEIRGPLGTVTGQVTGTYTAAGGLSVQETVDGTVWKTLAATTAVTRGTTSVQTATITSAEQDTYSFDPRLTGKARMRVTALGAVTGTAVVSLNNVPFGGGSSSGGSGSSDATAAKQDIGNASLSVMDDWDESDRAKVNIIVGQAGVAAGSGVAGATVIRVVNATDDPIISAINASNAQLPTVLGSQAAAASLGVTASTEDIARTGIITETAPASDTASSGLNGRLQRIAQRLSSWLASLTATANADANRLPVSLEIANPLAGTNAASGNLVSLAVGKAARCVVVDATSWTAGTQNFEFSDGVVTPYSVTGFTLTSAGSSGAVGSFSGVGQWKIPVLGTVFQVRQSSAGAGSTFTIIPVAADCPNITAVSVGNNSITTAGTGATGATISGNGFRATVTARTAAPTVTTTGQTTEVMATTEGKIVVLPGAIPEQTWQYAAASGGITNTTTAVTMAAALASNRNYVKKCQLSSDALGVATELVIRDGAAGTVIWRHKIGTAGILSYDIGFDPPLRGTVNTLTEVATLTASVTGGVFVNCQGYTAP